MRSYNPHNNGDIPDGVDVVSDAEEVDKLFCKATYFQTYLPHYNIHVWIYRPNSDGSGAKKFFYNEKHHAFVAVGRYATPYSEKEARAVMWKHKWSKMKKGKKQ